MRIRIAKDFEWEMSHRLTFHKGPCKNIHGHSYKLTVELEGETDEQLMLLDYYDVAKIVEPLTMKLDHAFVCDSEDKLMIDFLKENGFKHYIIEGFTTAENLAKHFLELLAPEFKKFENIKTLKVKLYETLDAFAELEKEL